MSRAAKWNSKAKAAPAVSGPVAGQCPACDQKIEPEEPTVTDSGGTKWHKAHYVCFNCAKPCALDSTSLKGGYIFCSTTCVNKSTCCVCTDVCLPKGRVVVGSTPYHNACFVCKGCTKPIDPSSKFTKKGTNLVHMDCYNGAPMGDPRWEKFAAQHANFDPKAGPSVKPDSPFKEGLLATSNSYRASHKAPALVYSKKAERMAQQWAENIASRGTMQHSDPKHRENSGENIYVTSDGSIAPKIAVDAWYNEIFDYDWKREPTKQGTGHFTQLVWAGTKMVGFGKAQKNGKTFVVAVFNPPGNVVSYHKTNVFPQESNGLSAFDQAMGRWKLFDPVGAPAPTDPEKRAIFDMMNKFRKTHGAPPLTYSAKAAAIAQAHCKVMDTEGGMFHAPRETRGELGENLYSSTDLAADAKVAVQAWYDEIKQFTFGTEPKVKGTGHFTQMVWKESTQCGIGVVKNPVSGLFSVVVNYNPPGNVSGRYNQNILKAR